jgi:uncharacterized protein
VDTDEFQPLDPRVRTVWLLGEALPFALLGLIGGTVVAIAGIPGLGAALAAMMLSVASAVALMVSARYRRWRWAAQPDSLELRHGVIRRTESSVPFRRLQQIDIVQGPIERMLGIATFVLRTAAATSDGRIPGIPLVSAETIRATLLRRAGRDDAV